MADFPSRKNNRRKPKRCKVNVQRHSSFLKDKEIGFCYDTIKNKRRADQNESNKIKKWRIETKIPSLELPEMNVIIKKFTEKEVSNVNVSCVNSDLREPKAGSSIIINQENTSFYAGDLLLNKQLKLDLENKMKANKYKEIKKFREKLPIYLMQSEILNMIENNQVVVISGETGCGKTTQITQFILDHYIMDGKGSICRVICTQPRRISAIAVAERVAQERGERCGDSIGYQIRLESKMPREAGYILYCTVGIILQWFQSNPYLLNISHMIIDEIHERVLESDFLLIIMKELLPKRPDLKLILMSATMNDDMFSKYFNNCPVLTIPGFTFQVKEHMLEDVLEITKYSPKKEHNIIINFKWKKLTKKRKKLIQKYEEWQKYVCSLVNNYSSHTLEILSNFDEENIDFDLIIELIKNICTTQSEGALLIFLSGWDEIRKLHTLMTNDIFFSSLHYIILPLHSLMPTVSQKEIFNQPPLGIRKIILSTNIAETSITIDDIVYVIDCGKVKMNNFDIEHNIETLKSEWIARANSKQRKGRAGRTQPGICYHLFTKWKESQLEDYPLPEILRVRLETVCLKIKLLKLGDITTFINKAIQLPDMKALHLSIDFLKHLNAFDDEENLTSLGYHLAKLPLDPLTGKMILFGAIFSCLDPILTIAASLNFRDAFIIPLGSERLVDAKRKEFAANTQSDHLMFVRIFREWENAVATNQGYEFCRKYFLSNSILKMLDKIKQQFARYLCDLHFIYCDYLKHPMFNVNSNNDVFIKAIICAGLYPNVAKIKFPEVGKKFFSKPKIYTQENGRVSIHPKSVNYREKIFKTRFLVYYKKVQSSEIFIYDSTVVSPYSLLFFGGNISTGIRDSVEIVTIDNHIEFSCPEKISKNLIELRQKLDKFVAYKISHPGVVNWNKCNDECQLLKTIIDLITQEESNNDISNL